MERGEGSRFSCYIRGTLIKRCFYYRLFFFSRDPSFLCVLQQMHLSLATHLCLNSSLLRAHTGKHTHTCAHSHVQRYSWANQGYKFKVEVNQCLAAVCQTSTNLPPDMHMFVTHTRAHTRITLCLFTANTQQLSSGSLSSWRCFKGTVWISALHSLHLSLATLTWIDLFHV